MYRRRVRLQVEWAGVRWHWHDLLLAQMPGDGRYIAVCALTPSVDPHAGVTPFRPDWVVPLQAEGTLRPLFMFPSSHSDLAMRGDAEIARLMASNRPIWGLAHAAEHRALVRRSGVAALGAVYAQQIRRLQPGGPYLFFGNCIGGYLAWETAQQMLRQGDEITEVLFFEVPLRKDFSNVRPGPIPVDTANVWRLGHYYCPEPLPVRITLMMTPQWHGAGWWKPWEDRAQRGLEVVILPDDGEERRAPSLATAVNAWCTSAEVGLPA
jgi:hypothetical protein